MSFYFYLLAPLLPFLSLSSYIGRSPTRAISPTPQSQRAFSPHRTISPSPIEQRAKSPTKGERLDQRAKSPMKTAGMMTNDDIIASDGPDDVIRAEKLPYTFFAI